MGGKNRDKVIPAVALPSVTYKTLFKLALENITFHFFFKCQFYKKNHDHFSELEGLHIIRQLNCIVEGNALFQPTQNERGQQSHKDDPLPPS